MSWLRALLLPFTAYRAWALADSARRAELRRLGICIQCGTAPAEAPLPYCADCHANEMAAP